MFKSWKETGIGLKSIYLLVAILFAIPLFSGLSVLPIRIWDESRLAINALEMLQNGNWLVTHFESKPDMWNTKPPLMIWLQVLCMKLIGPGELALRIPSAVAGAFTCIALISFIRKQTGDLFLGLMSVMVLVCSHGYIQYHGTRSGDYDALLTLWTTLSCLHFYNYTIHRSRKQLFYFFLFLTLAVLTKSISGLLFIPALIVYSLYQKTIWSMFKNRDVWLGFTFFIIIIGGFYLLREKANPGFLKMVYENELGGRFFQVVENHGGGFWYYINNFINQRFREWHLICLAGIIIGLLHSDTKVKKISIYFSFLCIGYLLIISISKTKLEWYDLPLYPFLAFHSAVIINFLYKFLENFKWLNRNLRFNPTPYLLVILIFTNPYRKILDKTWAPREYKWDQPNYELGHYLQEAVGGRKNLEGVTLLQDGYYAQHLFYIYLLKDKKVNVDLKTDWQNPNVGNLVLVHQQHIKDYLNERYYLEEIDKSAHVSLFRIIGQRVK
ncbi:MAG: glycosyltransferase family 39 protein [Saprospiraceae bacterium]|nr:glycosyltransferase family 39 protein [Saprospiraceae bacterium]